MSGRQNKKQRRSEQQLAFMANHIANQLLKALHNQNPDAAINGLAWAAGAFCDQVGLPRAKLIALIEKAPTFNRQPPDHRPAGKDKPS